MKIQNTNTLITDHFILLLASWCHAFTSSYETSLQSESHCSPKILINPSLFFCKIINVTQSRVGWWISDYFRNREGSPPTPSVQEMSISISFGRRDIVHGLLKKCIPIQSVSSLSISDKLFRIFEEGLKREGEPVWNYPDLFHYDDGWR
jgi:hypothetical protein